VLIDPLATRAIGPLVLAVAIDGINFAASLVTLAALKQYAPALAGAIRRWRLCHDTNP